MDEDACLMVIPCVCKTDALSMLRAKGFWHEGLGNFPNDLRGPARRKEILFTERFQAPSLFPPFDVIAGLSAIRFRLALEESGIDLLKPLCYGTRLSRF